MLQPATPGARPREPRLWPVDPGASFGGSPASSGLRGTAFDLFRHTAERRMERALIGGTRTCPNLACEADARYSGTKIAEICVAPMQNRGYGPVKERPRQGARGVEAPSRKASGVRHFIGLPRRASR